MPKYIEKPETIREKRQASKIASKTDRSIHKKTDQKIHTKKSAKTSGITGIIHSILADKFYVYRDGSTIECSIKGELKKNRYFTHNIAAVGDYVNIEEIEPGTGVITSILPRKSSLHLTGSNPNKTKILAANADILVIVTAANKKNLDHTLIDRYLIAASLGNLIPILVINKMDLAQNIKTIEEIEGIYSTLYITVVKTSCIDKTCINKLDSILNNHTVIFAGASGVGKSSLINALSGSNLKTATTTKKRTGRNTTTNATIIRVNNFWFVDTPGVQFLNITISDKYDVPMYFDEIFEAGKQCKFSSCLHYKEQNCHVKQLVSSGHISKLRYTSFCKIIKESSKA